MFREYRHVERHRFRRLDRLRRLNEGLDGLPHVVRVDGRVLNDRGGDDRVVDAVGSVLHLLEDGRGLVDEVDLEADKVGDLVGIPVDGDAKAEPRVSQALGSSGERGRTP